CLLLLGASCTGCRLGDGHADGRAGKEGCGCVPSAKHACDFHRGGCRCICSLAHGWWALCHLHARRRFKLHVL
ncbi:unnamed protein product, partial [Symbiodinium sp. CCMP2456]